MCWHWGPGRKGGGERGQCDRRSLETACKEKEDGERQREQEKGGGREGVCPGWAVLSFT